jgi:hypothetical protein
MHRLVDQNGEVIGMYEALKRYGANATYEPPAPRSADEELDLKVRKLRAANPRLSYSECFHAILQDPDNSELKLAFARELYR